MTDAERESEIECCMQIGIDRAYPREARVAAFKAMAELIAERSPERVREMEMERGINSEKSALVRG